MYPPKVKLLDGDLRTAQLICVPLHFPLKKSPLSLQLGSVKFSWARQEELEVKTGKNGDTKRSARFSLGSAAESGRRKPDGLRFPNLGLEEVPAAKQKR